MYSWSANSGCVLWIAFRFCIFVLWTQLPCTKAIQVRSCELLSDFVYSFFEHNPRNFFRQKRKVVNCFQILYIRSLNTIIKFITHRAESCELLSDFVYSFFEHNSVNFIKIYSQVVNCFQILYIRSLNTIQCSWYIELLCCELLSDFVYSFFEHNIHKEHYDQLRVVNCFQILYIRSLNTIILLDKGRKEVLWIAFRFCIFVLWTQSALLLLISDFSCELLSDFVYSFFEHNHYRNTHQLGQVVNCFQILYIRSLNTIASITRHDSGKLWIAFRFCIFVLWTQSIRARTSGRLSCELLSDFVYSFFEHNIYLYSENLWVVVNCFQILYIRSLNTIRTRSGFPSFLLWIAFRFCIFVLWTQWKSANLFVSKSCELLSDFVYSFFEHNLYSKDWKYL